jgi:class 3 adenylate cyclase
MDEAIIWDEWAADALYPPRGSVLSMTDAARDPELLVLMVTDVVEFSAMVCQLGDARAQRVIRFHNRILRACIRNFDGREIDHTGDGLFAAFAHADAALACAGSIQQVLSRCRSRGMDIHVRVGLNAGKPLIEEDRLFGHAVNVTFRVCTAAQTDEVVVAENILMHCAGSRWEFRGRRAATLKGIKDRVDLYTLCWSAKCGPDYLAIAKFLDEDEDLRELTRSAAAQT